MKTYLPYLLLFPLLYFLSFDLRGQGQDSIRSHGNIPVKLLYENAFLDASEFTISRPDSIGRGLYFPRTDLTLWKFIKTNLDGTNFPTAFHGMIVYNSGTGQTILGEGKRVIVTPGFYFFYNPGATMSITNGEWVRMLSALDLDTHLDSLSLLGDTALVYHVAGTPFDTIRLKEFASGSVTEDADFYRIHRNTAPDSIIEDVWTQGSISFGNSTGVDGSGSFASGENSMAGGTDCEARSPNSLALGYKTVVDGHDACIGLGYQNRIIKDSRPNADSTQGAIALGVNNVSGGQGAFAAGDSCKAVGKGNIALGKYSEATGRQASFALGEKAITSGFRSYAIGHGIRVTGDYSMGISLADLTDSNVVVSRDHVMAIMGGNVGFQTTQELGKLTVGYTPYKIGGGTWQVPSDIRAKENIMKYSKGLEKLLQLRPVSFNYISDKEDGEFPKKRRVGFIAQEVEKILPSMIRRVEESEGIKDLRIMNINELTYLLINGAKTLSSQDEARAKKLMRIEALQQQLRSSMDQLLTYIKSRDKNLDK